MQSQVLKQVINELDPDLSENEIASLMASAQAETDQRSDQWFEDRLGKVTASQVKSVVARGRYDKPYEDYYKYMIELAIERVLEKRKRFTSRYTDHGNEYEPAAAAYYEDLYPERDVIETGFIEHGELACGASPDRLVDDDGLIEIKAPNTDTLVKYLVSMIEPEIDGKENPDYELVKLLGLKGSEWKFYMEQMQMQMWITGRKWCDFVVYDPDMEENTIIKRVERDDEWIDGIMLPRILEFLDGVDKLERYLRRHLETANA